jgi:purine-binding chemotaxis protein CheW
MSDMVRHVTERAAELRREFDRAFAEPVRIEQAAKEDLLGIRVGGLACALRLSEIGGLFVDRKMTRVPGSDAALRGIVGFRGALLPVYDLATLLGRTAPETPRWLVIAAGAPVAFAFDAFERQLRVSRDEILSHTAHAGLLGYAREIARTQTFIGPILHLPSVLEAISASRAGPSARKEQ